MCESRAFLKDPFHGRATCLTMVGVQNTERRLCVALSAGTPLCPYESTYRGAYG